MAKQPKNLLSNFGNVAKDNSKNVDMKEENRDKNNVNKEVNSNVNNNSNDNKDAVYSSENNEEQTDNLVDNLQVNDPKRKYTKPKTVLDVLVDPKKTKKQMAFYLDHDVSEAIDRLNTLGKGRIKSMFVNEVLRDALKREGLL